ncbi:hypothetical protein GCM10028802_03370 [Terrabacter terrigena]
MRWAEPDPPGGPIGTPPVRAPVRGLGTRSVRSYAVMPLRYATNPWTPEPRDSVPRLSCFVRSVPGARPRVWNGRAAGVSW